MTGIAAGKSLPTLAAVLLLLLPTSVSGRQLPTIHEETSVTAVEVVIGVRGSDGRILHSLDPSQLQVFEDGAQQRIVSLVAASAGANKEVRPQEGEASRGAAGANPEGAWQVLIYFDQALSSVRSIKDAAAALAAQAKDLVALGPVEIVFAAPRPIQVLAPSRDSVRVAQALRKIRGKRAESELVLKVRRDYLRTVRESAIGNDLLTPRPPRPDKGLPRGTGAPGSGTVIDVSPPSPTATLETLRHGTGSRQNAMLARNAAQHEAQLIAQQRIYLRDWLSRSARQVPRLLILVSDGFDTSPQQFYLSSYIDSSVSARLEQDLTVLDQGQQVEQTSELLAADGWTVLGMTRGSGSAEFSTDASHAGEGRLREFTHRRSLSSRGSGNRIMIDPYDPLLRVTDATGGILVVDPRKTESALEDLRSRWVLTYQVSRAPDGRTHSLQVVAAQGLKVEAPRYVAAVTPARIAVIRAERMLAGSGPAGDLPLHLSLHMQPPDPKGTVQSGQLDASLDLHPLSGDRTRLTRGSIRVTIAVVLPDGRISITQQIAREQNLSQLAAWLYHAPMRLSLGCKRVAVVPEQLETGSWGGASAPLSD